MSNDELHRILGYTPGVSSRFIITWQQQSRYRVDRDNPENPLGIFYRGDDITIRGALQTLTEEERARGVKERARITKDGKVYITLNLTPNEDRPKWKTAVLQLEKDESLVDLLDRHITL